MDYTQEQSDELEALSSIFMDDLEEVTDVPSGWSPVGSVWKVVIAPQEEEDKEMEFPPKVELVFAHTPTYPDEAPLLRARGVQNISDADVGALQSMLEEQVEANLGMAMIYTLISVAQEWIQDRAASAAVPSSDPAAEERRRREEEERRQAEMRAHGTPVTPETFADWKARFDAEMALERTKLEGSKATEERQGKLTGKLWFQQQEAQHLEVEEPELEADEEDGEDDRANWEYDEHGGEEDEDDDEDLDYDDEDDDDEDELLEEMLAAKGS